MSTISPNVTPVQKTNSKADARHKQRPKRNSPEDVREDRGEGSVIADGFFKADFRATPLHPLQTAPIQAKLAVGQPGDALEQEADRVAERIANGNGAVEVNPAGSASIQRSAASSSAARAAPAAVQGVLSQPGIPLPPSLQAHMGQRFRRDFSDVRLHRDRSAEQSATALNAHAYTVGRNIVFGPGAFAPDTSEGRRLIAHELTHVVQQSRSHAQGLVQRDPKDDAKTPGRAKVIAAMDKLKTKYGLKEVSEENGVVWSEAELRRIDASFAKLSGDEKEALKGVYLVRTDKLTTKHKGKDVKLDAITINGIMIKFTAAGTTGNAPVHEVGHVIQSKVLRDAEQRLHGTQAGFELSLAKANLERAVNAAPKRFFGSSDMDVQSVAAFNASLEALAQASGKLLNSSVKDIKANSDAVQAAEMDTDATRGPVEAIKGNATTAGFLEVHNRWKLYVAALLNWSSEKENALEPRADLTEFVALVKKNNLARRSFRPFTSYVESYWPDSPEELFAESFSTFRNDPNYMQAAAKPLYEWFQKQHHLDPRAPKKPSGPTLDKKFSAKREQFDTARKDVLSKTPVLNELVDEAEKTFLPGIEGALEIASVATGE